MVVGRVRLPDDAVAFDAADEALMEVWVGARHRPGAIVERQFEDPLSAYESCTGSREPQRSMTERAAGRSRR